MTFDDCAFYAGLMEDPVGPAWGMWRQRDGSTISIHDMTEPHIHNCLRMVMRTNPESHWVNVFSVELERRGCVG